MNTLARKKSPRAPSIHLEDAIDKACKIYDKERRHPAPTEGVAQHLGYKNAANGAALSTIASLKYYGLLERPKEGMLAVSKDVEVYRFAPSESIKHEIVTKWLKTPQIFAELLEQYVDGLPSDATIKYELIKKGFAPAAADLCLQVFRRSVDFAHYYDETSSSPEASLRHDESDAGSVNVEEDLLIEPASKAPSASLAAQPIPKTDANDQIDRIPIRLTGGRRAWIEIPMPFYEADKERLKKQIDLLLTNDDEDSDEFI